MSNGNRERIYHYSAAIGTATFLFLHLGCVFYYRVLADRSGQSLKALIWGIFFAVVTIGTGAAFTSLSVGRRDRRGFGTAMLVIGIAYLVALLIAWQFAMDVTPPPLEKSPF